MSETRLQPEHSVSDAEQQQETEIRSNVFSHSAGGPDGLPGVLNLAELEERVRGIIPKGAFDFIASGAGDEWTLGENRRAFTRREILPRVYAGVDQVDVSTHLLGIDLATPIIAAPTMGHGLVHADAEFGAIKGLARANVLFTLSCLSSRTLEDVAQQATGPLWFQLYQQDDDGITRELVQRAAAAGYKAIVQTVDADVAGNREANLRNQFTSPPSLALANFASAGGVHRRKKLSWADLELVQKYSDLPVIPKGIQHPEDAAQAVRLGAAAIWISNHGARQLDGVPSAFTVLPTVHNAVAGRVPIILDGGVRRGQDVFKALALGASAVAIGRPVLYGLALGGADGVAEVFRRLTGELSNVMQLAGVSSLAGITPSALL